MASLFLTQWKCVNDVLELCQNPKNKDVTLICSGGKVQINSLLLASVFPIVKDLLEPWSEEMFISLPDVFCDQLSNFFNGILLRNSELKISKQIFDLLSKSILKFEEIGNGDIENEFTNEVFNDDDNNLIDDDHRPSTPKLDVIIKEDPDEDLENHSDNEYEEASLSSRKDQFECNLCDYKSRFSHNMKRHKLRHERGDFNKKPKKEIPECKECGESFKTTGRLNKHIRTVHKTAVIQNLKLNQHKCPECDYQSWKKYMVTRHYEQRHVRTLENGYQRCPKCKLKISSDESKSHECVFYSCEICGKQYNSIDGVRVHKKKVHEEIRENKCEECGKIFERSTLLKNHMEVVHQEKVSCHICGGSYAKKHLRTHLQTHREKTICTICEKEVRNLARHIESMHTSDDKKSHHCHDCGKGFTNTEVLRRHQMSVHLKLRPYKCRYGCTFAYNDQANRNAHERKSHGQVFKVDEK